MEILREYIDKGNWRRYRDLQKVYDKQDAYLIGYLYGDGGFITNGGSSFMSVSSINWNVIEAFKDRFCPDQQVRNIGKKSSTKVKATNDVYELRFPPKFSKQLEKFGLFCKKKDRSLKGVPDKFFINVLHGLIDADGFWTVGHRKDCRSPRLRIMITHRSQHFLVDVQRKLEMLYNVSSTIVLHDSGQCYRLSVQNTSRAIMLAREIIANIDYTCNDFKLWMIKEYLNNVDMRPKSDELLEPVEESAA